MDLIKYQKQTESTAVYPKEKELEYVTLGLVGEAGEVANKVKKVLRGDYLESAIRSDISKEIGDIMYYLARLCDHLDIELYDVINENAKKLADRKERDVIKGSGDNR